MSIQNFLRSINRQRPIQITKDQEDVLDFVETFSKPPPTIDGSYLSKVRNAASLLGISAGDEEDACAADAVVVPVPVPPEQEEEERIETIVDSHIHAHSAYAASNGFKLRNDVFLFSKENRTVVSNLIPSLGFLTANLSNFSAISAGLIDSSIVGGDPRDHRRQTGVPSQQQSLEFKGGLFDLLSRTDQQSISQGSFLQFSHIEYKIPQGGRVPIGKLPTTVEDLARSREELDERSLKAFSAARPRIVFTCDYAPRGPIEGCVVCWRKMPTASGYRIKRRNVIDGSETSITLLNDELERLLDPIRDYVRERALGFYEDISEDRVVSFLDRDIPQHGFFLYTVTAFQSRIFDVSKLFFTPISAVPFGPVRRAQLRRLMEERDPGSGPDTVSPYPVLSSVILGSEEYDWILAAVNLRHSERRGDSSDVVRKFSYFDAQLDFLVDQGVLGRFLVPADLSAFKFEFSRAISISGIVPVVIEALRATGSVTRFGDEKKFFEAVLAAIDPESGVTDLRTLKANLNVLLGPGGSQASFSRSAEVAIGTSAPETSVSSFVRKVDAGSFEGFGELMRTIRDVSDRGGL